MTLPDDRITTAMRAASDAEGHCTSLLTHGLMTRHERSHVIEAVQHLDAARLALCRAMQIDAPDGKSIHGTE